MRFGMWAAAAAAMVCATQASAATFIQYTFSGTGTQQTSMYTLAGSLVSAGPTLNRDVSLTFVVDIDQYPASISQGLYGPVFPTQTSQTITYTDTGLTGSGNSDTAEQLFTFFSVNADFNGMPSAGGFVTSLNSSAAAGSFNVSDRFYPRAVGNASISNITGNINSVGITRVDAFQPFSFTAVPEPASWLLMILGMGAIGAALRRRRPVLATA